MDEQPVLPRPAARALLFDDTQRLLLFRIAPEATQAKRPLWMPPGGGVNEGETYLDAVYREIWEETGLREVEVGPCIWYRNHRFEHQGRLIEQQERYFVARCNAFELVTEYMEPGESDFLAEHRWWAVPDLVASDEWFIPRSLAAHLPGIVAGELPAEPFDVGT